MQAERSSNDYISDIPVTVLSAEERQVAVVLLKIVSPAAALGYLLKHRDMLCCQWGLGDKFLITLEDNLIWCLMCTSHGKGASAFPQTMEVALSSLKVVK